MIENNIEGKQILSIFENFSVDRQLPKFKKEKSSEKYNNFGDSTESEGFLTTNSVASWVSTGGTSGSKSRPSFSGFFNKISNKVKDLFLQDPEKVFRNIINSTKRLSELNFRMVNFESMMEEAKRNGQTALYEKMKDLSGKFKIESILKVSNFDRFISEEDLIKFVQQSKRGIRLDWIRNFNRFIPDDVLSLKFEADKLKIFDNYVILHYDPNGESTKLTKEEIRRKKDPILFGVCRESRNLYFIGDWKDEYCDLTFEQVVQEVGKDKTTIK